MATVRAGFRRLGLYEYLDGFKGKGMLLSHVIEQMHPLARRRFFDELFSVRFPSCGTNHVTDRSFPENPRILRLVFNRSEGCFDRKNNRQSGLIGIVLPEMEKEVFLEKSVCEHCGSSVETVCVDDSTVLREFRENYWLVKNGCGHYSEDVRFCILVRYSEFMNKGKAEEYIGAAFQKTKADMAKQVHYRDIRHRGLKNYK